MTNTLGAKPGRLFPREGQQFEPFESWQRQMMIAMLAREKLQVLKGKVPLVAYLPVEFDWLINWSWHPIGQSSRDSARPEVFPFDLSTDN